MGLKRDGDRFRYTDRETMLYAMATVLTRMAVLKDCGFDYTKVVHGEQRLTLHRPLPPEGELIAAF